MEKKRIYYFDLAKGIGIFLVVLGHLEYISMNLRYYIVAFHMPMFFIISGMLICLTGEVNRPFSSLVKGKLYRIMMPYLSFSILYFIIDICYLKLTGITTWETVWDNVYQSVCLYGVSVLWFLPALFFGELIFIIIRKRFSNMITGIIMAVIAVVMYLLNWQLELYNMLYGIQPFFHYLHYFLAMIIRCFFAAVFICIGYYLYFILKDRKGFSLIELILGIVFMGITLVISQINGAVDIHFLIFGKVYLYLPGAILGSMGVILLCKCLEPVAESIPCRIVRYFGVNSLIVMATHINSYILYGAIIISLHLIQYVTRARNYVFCANIMIIVFLSEVIVIEIINRYLPFFAGKKRQKKAEKA